MEKFAVIVAGGSGTRMGHQVPKQFLPVAGVPLLVHTISRFLEAYPDIRIILVLPRVHIERGVEILATYHPAAGVEIVEGGATRFGSVSNGLQQVADDALVFVHDAVRCLVSPSLIRTCGEYAEKFGSAIPVIPVKDSVRRIIPGGSEVLDREQLRAVQTPQVFHAGVLKKVFLQEWRNSFTDEATVYEAAGLAVQLVEGEESNIKVTYPSDLLLAEQYFSLNK
jgi:2-C-methyl-D-erythritol 4-phosphate cytidylyltransferase